MFSSWHELHLEHISPVRQVEVSVPVASRLPALRPRLTLTTARGKRAWRFGCAIGNARNNTESLRKPRQHSNPWLRRAGLESASCQAS